MAKSATKAPTSPQVQKVAAGADCAPSRKAVRPPWSQRKTLIVIIVVCSAFWALVALAAVAYSLWA